MNRSLVRSSWRTPAVVVAAVVTFACGAPSAPAPARTEKPAAPPTDPQHQGLTEPHGDHSSRRGGMVLMNGDIHYEVVLSREGRHRIWFTDPVRADLPASVATGVTMIITRPGEPDEVLRLAIDENGESWIANGRDVPGNDAYVKIIYAMQGEPHEVEIPFVLQAPPTQP
jgi:predicted secreted protein